MTTISPRGGSDIAKAIEVQCVACDTVRDHSESLGWCQPLPQIFTACNPEEVIGELEMDCSNECIVSDLKMQTPTTSQAAVSTHADVP